MALVAGSQQSQLPTPDARALAFRPAMGRPPILACSSCGHSQTTASPSKYCLPAATTARVVRAAASATTTTTALAPSAIVGQRALGSGPGLRTRRGEAVISHSGPAGGMAAGHGGIGEPVRTLTSSFGAED